MFNNNCIYCLLFKKSTYFLFLFFIQVFCFRFCFCRIICNLSAIILIRWWCRLKFKIWIFWTWFNSLRNFRIQFCFIYWFHLGIIWNFINIFNILYLWLLSWRVNYIISNYIIILKFFLDFPLKFSFDNIIQIISNFMLIFNKCSIPKRLFTWIIFNFIKI